MFHNCFLFIYFYLFSIFKNYFLDQKICLLTQNRWKTKMVSKSQFPKETKNS